MLDSPMEIFAGLSSVMYFCSETGATAMPDCCTIATAPSARWAQFNTSSAEAGNTEPTNYEVLLISLVRVCAIHFVYVLYFGEQSQLNKSGRDSPPFDPSQWGVCGPRVVNKLILVSRLNSTVDTSGFDAPVILPPRESVQEKNTRLERFRRTPVDKAENTSCILGYKHKESGLCSV